jgi:hypothetical protein
MLSEARAQDWFAVCQDAKWGFIDANGVVKIKPKYDKAYPFNDGRAAVFLKGKGWSYVDSTGNRIMRGPFQFASVFSEGIALVQKRNSNWAYINRNGKVKYEIRDRSFVEGALFLKGETFLHVADRLVIQLHLESNTHITEVQQFLLEGELTIWDFLQNVIPIGLTNPGRAHQFRFFYEGSSYYFDAAQDSVFFFRVPNGNYHLVNLNSGKILHANISSLGFNRVFDEHEFFLNYAIVKWQLFPVLIGTQMAYINRKGEIIWIQD